MESSCRPPTFDAMGTPIAATSIDPLDTLRDVLPAGYGLDFASQVASDFSYQTRLCEEWIGQGNRSSILRLDDSIEIARQAYRGYDIVYSNRLHVLLLAMSAGVMAVPILAPGQSQKIRGVFEDLGLRPRIIEAGRGATQTDTNTPESPEMESYHKAQLALVGGLANALGGN